MSYRKRELVVAFLACLLLAADDSKKADSLDGTWTLSSGEADGKPLTEKQLKDGKLVLKGGKYSVTLPERGTVTGMQKVDSAKSPKTIDITDDSGANKGKTCLGIYELKGDKFQVAFAPAGKPRPTKFTTAPDSGHWMHVWTRAKD